MVTPNKVFKDALELNPEQKAELIDRLMESLNPVDPQLNLLWEKEVESRIEAFKRGEMKAVPLEDVLQKY